MSTRLGHAQTKGYVLEQARSFRILRGLENIEVFDYGVNLQRVFDGLNLKVVLDALESGVDLSSHCPNEKVCNTVSHKSLSTSIYLQQPTFILVASCGTFRSFATIGARFSTIDDDSVWAHLSIADSL